MNTIGDMQNEKYFYGYYNESEYIQDFFDVLDKNVYLLYRMNNFTI